MKKLPLSLLLLLSGAFVLQGADWVFEIPEGEFSYWVGVELLAVEEDFGDSAVSYPSVIPAKIAEAIANNINVRSLSGILKDKLVATSIGSKVYVDRKDKTATGYLGSVVGVIIEQWNKNGTPANLDDDVHVPLALLPESTFKGEGEEGEGEEGEDGESLPDGIDGLVAHFKFDESLEDAVDGDVGVATMEPRYDEGAFGTALWFDVEDKVTISAADLPMGNAARTLSLWVKDGGSGSVTFIATWGTFEGAKGFGLIKLGDKWAGYAHGNDADSGVTVSTDWTHVAVTHDGEAMRTYVDGVAKGSLDVTLQTAGDDFVLGMSLDGGMQWKGWLDDVRVYDRALSVEEISIVMDGEDGEDGEDEGEEGEEVGNRTPVVKNVAAAQVEGTKLLRVNYDLEVSDGRPCTVTIRWSTNNGETFDTTAAAIVGDVGPGVDPGEKLEAIWDMGEDWNNKYTEKGRVEVIANRIGPEEEDHVVIEHHTGIWELTDNEDFIKEKPPTEWRFVVIADSPGAESTMPAEDRKALEAAIETGSIRFVDVFYKDKDGVEHAFWFDGQHPSVAYKWYGINSDRFSVSATHGSPIEDSTDLLTLDAIDHLGEGERPKIRVGGIPSHVSVLQDPEGEGSLRMEIFIEPGEHVE